jgi:predicted flap endonuclease-1-like 5' DNA nuclease
MAMPRNPLDYVQMARDRDDVFAIRSRYYRALRTGMAKADAVAYANDPEAKMPDVTATLPVLNTDELPKVVRVPEEAARPEPTPRELEERRNDAQDAVAPEPHSSAPPDDLEKINGVGPGTLNRLNAMGITTFKQLAAWSQADAERIDNQLNLRGRVTREDWIGQAQKLVG